MEVIEVETLRPAQARRRLPSWWPGAALLLAGAAAAALWFGGGDDQDGEPVPPRPFDGVLSPDEAVALTWESWQAKVSTSECLAAHDFTWAPSLEGEAWIVPAARRLEVEPRYVEIPPREEGPDPVTFRIDDYRIEESSRWYATVAEGGCVVTPGPVNIADQAAVDAAVNAAASDAAFKEALAAESWRQEHPEAWLSLWIEAFFAIDREPLHDADAAAEALDEAVTIASEATTWALLGTQYTDLSASAYGVDGEGHVVVIAVEENRTYHPVTWAYGGDPRFQLHCDGFQLFVATRSLYSGGSGADGLSTAVWDALGANWCGGDNTY